MQGVVVVSFASQGSIGGENAEPRTDADPTEADELSRTVLGIIGAYRMGAALDGAVLAPKGSTSASPPLDDRSPV